MPRPRAYDRAQVLDSAMQLFWRQGYEATSIQDLVAATGINRASMYNGFGDKRELFRAAIAHYLQQVSAKRAARLESAASPLQGLRDYFEELIVFSLGDGRKLGCLLTNSALELAPHDAELAEELTGIFERVEATFARAIEAAQAAGEIPAEKNPRDLACFLLNTVHGLRVQGRLAPDPKRLRAIVDTALGALR